MMFIGEIGINHNGNLDTALKLIDEAKRCGVDVVKFQKRDPDICVPEHQKNVKRIWKGREMTYIEYKYDVEFWEEEYDIINQHCKDIGIQWTVSVWDVPSVEFMKRYTNDIPFIKIPSACITDLNLIKAINDWDIPVVFSDGMSTEKEIRNDFMELDNLIGILHCNSSYPCTDEELDMNVIRRYQDIYDGLMIGYSGHEIDTLPSLVASSMGVDIIERYITLDKNMEGSDHKCSLDIKDLEELLKQFKRIKTMMGNYYVTVYDSEKKARNKLRNKKYDD